MMTRRGFEILFMYGGGSRIVRLTIPRWAAVAGAAFVVLVVALQSAVWIGYLSTRGADTPAARVAHSADPVTPRAPDPRPSPPPPAAVTTQTCPVPAAVASALAESEQEQRKATEAIQRRVDKIAAEVTSWSAIHATIWRSVGPDHGKGREPRGVGGPVSSAVAIGTGDAPVTAQLDRLLATVTEEGQKLRALNRFMARAGRLLAALPSRWPLRGSVNSEFGRRPSPWTGEPELHHGIDIAANVGTPVTAPGPATVAFAGSLAGYGNTVLLDHGHEVQSRFGHLHTIRVARGQRVQRGDVIGLAGSTGRSTGPHLHYEVLVKGAAVNPRTYMWE